MYQPVYGTIRDDNVTRTSSSRKGKITSVSFEANTHFGQAIRVNVSSDGTLPKKDECEAKNKIISWMQKENIKKAIQWKDKLNEREKYNKEQLEKEKVDVFVHFDNTNPKIKLRINQIMINMTDLTLIVKHPEILEKLRIADSL